LPRREPVNVRIRFEGRHAVAAARIHGELTGSSGSFRSGGVGTLRSKVVVGTLDGSIDGGTGWLVPSPNRNNALHVDGRDLLGAGYAERRRALERLCLKQGRWLTTPSLQGEAGAALYAFTLNQRWEGVVAKGLDSMYRPAGRDGSWLKAKHPHARDLLVGRSEMTHRERILEPRIAYN